MPIPSTMADLSTTAASNSPAGTDSPTSGDDYLRSIQAIIRTTNAKGADIASAATTDIGAATGEFVDVTGTTTITSLGTAAAGIVRTVRFTGALTLTHNATSLQLPGSANITTANGDVAQFRSLGSGNWKCVNYMKVNGLSAQPATNVNIDGGSIDATSIGATTPSTGAFTTLSSTGNATLGDAEDTDTHAIKGATTLLANSASSALTVTQTGSGNAFVVEDSASTDATPFVIDNAGNVGIGTAASSTRKVNIAHTQSDTANTEIANNVVATATNTSGAVTKIASFSNVATGTGYAGTGALYGNYAQATHSVTGTAASLIANIGIIANTSTGTVTSATNYQASSATNSGGGTISQQIGFICNDLTAATANYGFYSSVNSGANKFGFYAEGTARNAFKGNIEVISGTAVLGYGTGAGGTATQGAGSGKATAVTLNKPCGQITMNNAILNAGTIVSFTLTNSNISAADTILINHQSVGTLGAYLINGACAAGSATISVRNTTAGNLTEAIVLNFTVIKGATS